MSIILTTISFCTHRLTTRVRGCEGRPGKYQIEGTPSISNFVERSAALVLKEIDIVLITRNSRHPDFLTTAHYVQ